MVPSVIPPGSFERWGIPTRAIQPYDGLKEYVYLAGFRPAPDARERLGVDPGQLLVTFRPIAHHAKYNDDSGEALQRRLLEALATNEGVCVLILPRTEVQRRTLEPLARRCGTATPPSASFACSPRGELGVAAPAPAALARPIDVSPPPRGRVPILASWRRAVDGLSAPT